MTLVSFFSDDNVLSDEIKICYYTFEIQSNENRAFRIFGTPGISYVQGILKEIEKIGDRLDSKNYVMMCRNEVYKRLYTGHHREMKSSFPKPDKSTFDENYRF